MVYWDIDPSTSLVFDLILINRIKIGAVWRQPKNFCTDALAGFHKRLRIIHI